MPIKQKVIETLQILIEEILGTLDEVPDTECVGSQEVSNETIVQRRAAFKAATYLFAITIQVAEKTSTEKSTIAEFEANMKKNKKGGRKSKKNSTSESTPVEESEIQEVSEDASPEEKFDWASLRPRSLRLLADCLLRGNLHKLWNLGVPEEDYVLVYLQTSFRVLYSQSAMKDKDTRRAIIVLLCGITAKFPFVTTFTCVSFVDAICKEDFISGVAIECTEIWSRSDGIYYAPQVVSELLREVGRVSGGDSSRQDASRSVSVRRTGTFLSEVCSKLPHIALTNITNLLPHLDSDAPSMRAALVSVLATIVANEAMDSKGSKGSNETPASASTKSHHPAQTKLTEEVMESLLFALIERVHDVHAHVRLSVLRAFSSLAEVAKIPAVHLPKILDVVISRVLDKSNIVRRAALQCFRALVEYNPFGSRLNWEELHEQAEAAESWLRTNAPQFYSNVLMKDDRTKGVKKDNVSPDETDKQEGVASRRSDESNCIGEDPNDPPEKGNEEDPEQEHGSMQVANDVEQEEQITVTQEMLTWSHARSTYKASSTFAKALTTALPDISVLLASKISSDTMEAIRALGKARDFSVVGAEAALGGMLNLIWSTNDGVRDEILRTFDRLYILNESLEDFEEPISMQSLYMDESISATQDVIPPTPADPERKSTTKAKKNAADVTTQSADPSTQSPSRVTQKTSSSGKRSGSTAAYSDPEKTIRERELTLDPAAVADNLINLVHGVDKRTLAAAEEAIQECCKRGLLPPSVVARLWDITRQGVQIFTKAKVNSAMALLTAIRKEKAFDAPEDAHYSVSISDAVKYFDRAKSVVQQSCSALAILVMMSNSKSSLLPMQQYLPDLLTILKPKSIEGVPVGHALLQMSVEYLPVGTPLTFLEPALSDGHYEMATHAAKILQTFPALSILATASGSKSQVPKAVAPSASQKKKANKANGSIVQSLPPDYNSLRNAVDAMESILLSRWDGGEIENTHWYACARECIRAIFALCPSPQVNMCGILQNLLSQLFLQSTEDGGIQAISRISTVRMSRFMFAFGHSVLQTLAFVEILAVRVKRIRVKVAEKMNQSNEAPDKGMKVQYNKENTDEQKEEDGIEAQLGGTVAEDETEAELVLRIAESELVSRNVAGLVVPFLRYIVTHILQNPAYLANPDLQRNKESFEIFATSAVLSLCKLSIVSSDLAESVLPLLVTLLSHSSNASLRGILVVTLADLAFRFPNSVEPYISHLYQRLRDADKMVRKSAVLVISHLILHDMIKIRGQVGEVAICIVDEDKHIADLAKVFFLELSGRSHNPIFAILPDTLACLSKLATSGHSGSLTNALSISATSSESIVPVKSLSKDNFREVVKYLLSFIAKDKLADALAEKLLDRFGAISILAGASATEITEEAAPAPLKSESNTTNEMVISGVPAPDAQATTASALLVASNESNSEVAGTRFGSQEIIANSSPTEVLELQRDLAYCLTQLPSSERIIRRLCEKIGNYSSCLSDDICWESFSTLLQRAKRFVGLSAGADHGKSPSMNSATDVGSTATTGSNAALRMDVQTWEKALQSAREEGCQEKEIVSQVRAEAQRAHRLALLSGLNTQSIASRALEEAEAAVIRKAQEEKEEAMRKKKQRTRAPVSRTAKRTAQTKKRANYVDSSDDSD